MSEQLSEISDADLKKEATVLFDLVYNLECGTEEDNIRLEELHTELNKRGYLSSIQAILNFKECGASSN